MSSSTSSSEPDGPARDPRGRIDVSSPSAVEDTSARVSRGAALRRIALQMLLGLVVAALFTGLSYYFVYPARYRLLPQQWRAVKPQIAMVGNSLLRAGVDEELLEERTGKRILKVTADGSKSAFWYLFAKNIVAPGQPPAEMLVIPFCDQRLTAPRLGVVGQNGRAVRALAGPEEPLVDRLAWRPALGFSQNLAYKHWHLVRMRDTIRDALERKLRSRVLGPLLGKSGVQVGESYLRVLDDQRMDRSLIARYQLDDESEQAPELFDFAAQIDQSFLPAILQVTRDADVDLVLVRLRRRRDAAGEPVPPAVQSYVRDLRVYLEAHGVPLIDFTDEPSLELRHFAAGDHLGPEGRDILTARLAEQLQPYLRP